MAITPKDPAHFDPAMGDYKDLKPFRMWCQKVLPLVYDDSLSYYEVLCKLVDYLNKTMEDVGVLHDDVDALLEAYQLLQGYVNDYFSTLDVQQEINNKLDVMAEDGTLDRILLPYFNAYTDEINQIVDTQTQRITTFEDDVNDTIDAQESRITNFETSVDERVTTQDNKISTINHRIDGLASLTEGSTTGDAELIDIRTGAFGSVFPSAGAAVRSQISEVESNVAVTTNCEPVKFNACGHYFDLSGDTVTMSGGVPVPVADAIYNAGYVPCTAGDNFIINGSGNVRERTYGFITSNGLIIQKADPRAVLTNFMITAPADSAFLIVNTSDGRTSYKNINADYKVNDVKQNLIDITGCEPLTFKFYLRDFDLSGTTANMLNNKPFPDKTFPDYMSTYYPCVAGDIFTINGIGGVTARLYAFVSSDGTILQKSSESANYTNRTVIAPENAAFIIVQTTDGRMSYKNYTVNNRLLELEKHSDFPYLITTGYYTQQFETGYGIKNNVAVGSIVNMNLTASADNACLVVYGVTKGMKFKVFGTSTYSYVLWSWLDKNNVMLSHASAWTPSHENGVVIEAPEGADKLVCNSKYDYVYGFNATYLGNTAYLSDQISAINAQLDPLKIKNNVNKNAAFKFVYFSDIHGSENNANHIKAYAEENTVNCIINGGDTITRYLNDQTYPLTWYDTWIDTSNVDILSAVGNHDVWDGAYWHKAADLDVYNAFIDPIITKFEGIQQPADAATLGLCYYYKDYGTVRVIILNAMAGDSSVNYWTTEEASWLTSVLTDAIQNNKHVLVCNHTPFNKNIAIRDNMSDWNSYMNYKTGAFYDQLYMTTEALNIINTFIQNGGTLIALLTGHTHVDSILTADGLTGQFMVNIASANYANHPDGIIYSDTGSPYYDCFDYGTVDTTNGLLKVYRIGWNMDASTKERITLTYDYINKQLIHD